MTNAEFDRLVDSDIQRITAMAYGTLPPVTFTDRVSRELQARTETATSIVGRGRTGMEITPRGCIVSFRLRDQAVCARALLEDQSVLRDTAILPSGGRFKVTGAWHPVVLEHVR